MDENPYQSPLVDDISAPDILGDKIEDLRLIAKYQRGVLVCILGYFLLIFGSIFLNVMWGSVLSHTTIALLFSFILCALFLLLMLVGIVYVFLLATKVYGIAIGIFAGLFVLIPWLGLLVLLAINGAASSKLKQNGFKVGLLGANLSQFSDGAIALKTSDLTLSENLNRHPEQSEGSLAIARDSSLRSE